MFRFGKNPPLPGFGLGVFLFLAFSLVGSVAPAPAATVGDPPAAASKAATAGTAEARAGVSEGAAGAGVSEGATTSRRRGGGIAIRPDPMLRDAYCVKRCVSRHRATPGSIVRLTGTYLNHVKRVVFPGKTKRMKVRFRARSRVAVRVVVPRGADDGRPFVIDARGSRSNRSPKNLRIVPRSRIPKEVFPIRGPFDYLGGGGRFGASRSGYSHQGQDISARCGAKLVVIKRARVIYNQYQSAAGNYIVFNNKGDHTFFAFMHMRKPSKLRVGEMVRAGETVGRVGSTGRAYGCHLHFEYWVGPWQTGGRPINPLPYLRSID